MCPSHLALPGCLWAEPANGLVTRPPEKRTFMPMRQIHQNSPGLRAAKHMRATPTAGGAQGSGKQRF